MMVDSHSYIFNDRYNNYDNTNKKKYDQKYRKSWESEEKFQGWLACMPGDSMSAFCKVCKTSLRARKKDLEDHQKSRKHRKHLERKIKYMGQILTEFPKEEPEFFDEYDDQIDFDYSINDDFFQNTPSTTNEPPKQIFNETTPTPPFITGTKPYSIEIVNTDEKEEKECTHTCCQNDDFTQFGRYVGNELRSVGDHLAVQRAKLEINRILYDVTIGEYDIPINQPPQNSFLQVDDENALTVTANQLANIADAQIQFM